MYVEQPFDVLHYDASVDLTKAPSKVMTGVCTITLRWVGDPKSGPFHFHLRSLVVDSVFYNDQRVDAVPVETPLSSTFHYEVMSPTSVKQNDTVTIRVYYGGTMTSEPGSPSWGGVSSISGTLFAMGVGIYNDYVSATQHWLPCYDHPSDKATFHAKFYVKSDYAVASNGTLIT
jgi:aminopeptidase N